MNQEKLKNNKFIIAILLTTIFMGTSFPTGKYLLSVDQVPPFLLGGWRFLIAGALMLLWSIMTGGVKSVIPKSSGRTKKGLLLVGLIGLLQTPGTMGFLNLAMAKGVSSSMSSIILFTNPLWLAVMAHFLLKDKLNRWKILSLFLGVAGVIICMGLDTKGLGIGLLFALLGLKYSNYQEGAFRSTPLDFYWLAALYWWYFYAHPVTDYA